MEIDDALIASENSDNYTALAKLSIGDTKFEEGETVDIDKLGMRNLIKDYKRIKGYDLDGYFHVTGFLP